MVIFLLTSNPYTQAAQSALYKLRDHIATNTDDVQIFLYADAVQFAHRGVWLPADSANPIQDFQQFLVEHKLNAQVCVSAALARGVTDESNAKRHALTDGASRPLDTLHERCQLVGLGELAMLLHNADKVYQF